MLAQHSLRHDDVMGQNADAGIVLLLTYIGEFLMVGLSAGAIAGFLVQTELSMDWVAVSGLLGTIVEPWLPLEYGPILFGHCIIACIAGSATMLLAVWLTRRLYRNLS